MTLPPLTPSADTTWIRRISADRERAGRNQTPEQRAITDEVMRRALDAGAVGFALTGSTARRRRTPISDLDYHVIGDRPDVSDLSAEVDVVATRPEHLRDRLLDGDDFVQWTVRLGCILYDAGSLFEASRLIASHSLWPDPQRKLDLAERLHAETLRLLRIGDREAAQEQLRAMLTTTARGLLLRAGVFPLARDELASQLNGSGYAPLARALSSTIYETPTLERLSRHLQTGVESFQTSKSPAPA
ncbi:MAG TPA: hypothetical protein VN618_08045 [Solirubrobacteraceae bacterium]|nr:hypothetical protein [Solirubrobacteraceae bacterium]